MDIPENFTSATRTAAKGKARERFLAIMFLKSVDRQCYKKVSKYLANNHTMETDTYRKTLTDVYKLLHNRQLPKKMGRQVYGNEGVTFAQ